MASKAETFRSEIQIKEEPTDPQSSPNKHPKTEISLIGAKGKLRIKNETSTDTCNQQQMMDYALASKQIVGVPIRNQMMDYALASKQIVGVPIRNQMHDKDLDAVGLPSMDPNSRNQKRKGNSQNVSSTEASVSVLDIVRGSGPYNVERSSSNQSCSPHSNTRDKKSIAAAMGEHNSRAEFLVGHRRGKSFEVIDCRNRDTRIRALRENWEKIRQGSLTFSSFPICKPGVGDLSSGNSTELNSSSTSNIKFDHARRDINKAWKMMKAAKSTEKKKHTNNIPSSTNGSKRPWSDMKAPKEYSSVRSMLLSSSHHGVKDQNGKQFNRPYRDCAAEKCEKQKLHMFQKEKESLNLSSSCNVNEARSMEKIHEDSEAKVDGDVKSEIQSLVKVNVKILSTKKKLDINEFKEVARLATHSILAACGIGTPKSWALPFPSPTCSHNGKVEQVKRSTLLPNSCRECFLVFVKDVVNTILLDKTTSK